MSDNGIVTSSRTESVLAHVLTERNMQRERYTSEHDEWLAPDTWDELITERLNKIGPSRYQRLIQVAALAVAAAELEEPR